MASAIIIRGMAPVVFGAVPGHFVKLCPCSIPSTRWPRDRALIKKPPPPRGKKRGRRLRSLCYFALRGQHLLLGWGRSRLSVGLIGSAAAPGTPAAGVGLGVVARVALAALVGRVSGTRGSPCPLALPAAPALAPMPPWPLPRPWARVGTAQSITTARARATLIVNHLWFFMCCLLFTGYIGSA